MPDIGLDGADVDAMLAEHVADGIGFNRVTRGGASSVALEASGSQMWTETKHRA